jgi:23S rRNA-/tRNA-specific pseudouridylate synthase
MKNIINLIVKDYENGQRVDRFISNKEKDLSRTRIKNLILNKKLKINKKTITDPSKFLNQKKLQ